MPYVNVRVTKDGLTREKKRLVVEQFTEVLVQVLGKSPEHIHVIIDPIEDENWGYSG